MGTRPDSELLDLDTTMGAVSLRVADVDTMTAYYRDAIGLTVLHQTSGPEGQTRVVLGHQEVPIVILDHTPRLRHAGSHEAGLYHTAIVYEREQDLAAAVYSTATRYPTTFVGSSDHAVSKAFYFTDPEGNGVELYWDRDRSTWSWANGHIAIKVDPLDINEYLREHLGETPEGAAASGLATVGHVHLTVGDVATAREFYVDRLGFEVTAELPGAAVFVSAGGYHHHMAMNTFDSRNAGRRQLTLGLGLVRIVVPTTDAVGQLDERLQHHNIAANHEAEGLVFTDPWNNTVQVAAGDA